MKKNYTYKEATPEQIKHWHETEGKWWADRGLTIVAIASVSTILDITYNGCYHVWSG